MARFHSGIAVPAPYPPVGGKTTAADSGIAYAVNGSVDHEPEPAASMAAGATAYVGQADLRQVSIRFIFNDKWID